MVKPIPEKAKKMAQLPILASIGHVCLRWALLEMTVLAVIAALEDVPTDKASLLYGGQNILPRFDTAIRLAAYHKAPNRIITELKSVKKLIATDVGERRNQAVHGAHADAQVLDAVKLTMTRWSEPKRTQTVSLEDFIKIAEDIWELEKRTVGVFEKIGEWRFGKQ